MQPGTHNKTAGQPTTNTLRRGCAHITLDSVEDSTTSRIVFASQPEHSHEGQAAGHATVFDRIDCHPASIHWQSVGVIR